MLELFSNQVADPAFLKVSPLSPEFLHRQVFFFGNYILGFYHRHSSLSFFAVSELDIIWVGCEITCGKVEKSSRWTSSPQTFSSQISESRFWVWGGHLWENGLRWGRILDPWGFLVSRLPLEGLRLPKVQVWPSARPPEIGSCQVNLRVDEHLNFTTRI